jgi:hypothetical protein
MLNRTFIAAPLMRVTNSTTPYGMLCGDKAPVWLRDLARQRPRNRGDRDDMSYASASPEKTTPTPGAA